MKFTTVRRKVEKALGRRVERRWSSGEVATFDLPYPESVCVSASTEAVEVFLPVFDWPMPHEMTLRFRRFKTLPARASIEDIRQIVQEAVEARRATFKICTGCNQCVSGTASLGKTCSA